MNPADMTAQTLINLPLGEHASTLFLSVPHAVELVRRKGLVTCLRGIADAIRADFLRWPEFDKSARVAAHSAQGVIELIPVAMASATASSRSTATLTTTAWVCTP